MADEKPGRIHPRTVVHQSDLPVGSSPVADIASSMAPFVYFDGACTIAFHNGVGMISLEAVRNFVATGDRPGSDSVTVCQLRASMPALLSLKAAIEHVVLLAHETDAKN
jgi:hypothetical protein